MKKYGKKAIKKVKRYAKGAKRAIVGTRTYKLGATTAKVMVRDIKGLKKIKKKKLMKKRIDKFLFSDVPGFDI